MHPGRRRGFPETPIVEGYGKSLQEVLAGTKTVEQALADADAINDTMRESLG